MSDLSTAIKNLKYDKRMRAWNIKQKYLTEEEWRKRIAGLRDMSSKAEVVPNPDPEIAAPAQAVTAESSVSD